MGGSHHRPGPGRDCLPMNDPVLFPPRAAAAGYGSLNKYVADFRMGGRSLLAGDSEVRTANIACKQAPTTATTFLKLL